MDNEQINKDITKGEKAKPVIDIDEANQFGIQSRGSTPQGGETPDRLFNSQKERDIKSK